MQFSDIRYNSYSKFLKETFGTRVHKVPVHAGFTCPNRDGTVAIGGCTYCNIDSFTPQSARARIPIREQVQTGIDYLKKRVKAGGFIVYFQPYSNTYAPLQHLQDLYEQALEHPDVVGISVGTRPDCVDDDKLDYFQQLSHDTFVTIEYGIESVHDQTLRIINRGHDYACTVDGIQRTAARGLNVCGHLILGFPNETQEQMFQTVEEVSKLPLTFVKLHNLHIVRYTELAKQYREHPFHIFSFEEWVHMACDCLERLNPEFIVERLYGDAPKKLLIEPQWCRNGAKIIHAIQQELKNRNSHQGRLFEPTLGKSTRAVSEQGLEYESSPRDKDGPLST
ncbi:TIGR01212 family radical SAM protein [candidate division KSB1 bacterium]|nr:TIGR01212 family radical SAM protein [candidate division KSB1 bacterium]NIR71383.1 TIGR01212 family radical SAM protein [candidate division KSB1 bacterium]NIS26277.1 TIGR01212 family radical SAM protein [candidate division KSB1 bacterium]NIT73039.1 TIGR01212 family radical SAM protein [candidate division KSB1 bacterium]NIU26947.1 TIGR01212 family radical SAM protein [candidate division KSB1 bacterium]